MRKHEMNKYYVCEISVAATKESARLQFTFACFSRSVNYHWQNEPFHGENKYLHRHRKWRKNLCTVSHTHTHKKHDVYKQISNLSDEVARFTIRKYAMKNWKHIAISKWFVPNHIVHTSRTFARTRTHFERFTDAKICSQVNNDSTSFH